MKKTFLLLVTGILMFAMVACGEEGGSNTDVVDKTGILGVNLSGDFLEDENYTASGDCLAGIGLYCDPESEYHGNSLKPIIELGTTTFTPPSNWVDSEVDIFLSYVYAENKQTEDVTIAGMNGKMATYEENGNIRKIFAVAGEPNDDGMALTLYIMAGNGAYPPGADEDFVKIANSVTVDTDAAAKALEEE